MGVTVFILMGPAGCGKTAVAQNLSEHYSCAYIEGDNLHPAENIAKMSNGIALRDEDRWQWLATVRQKFLDKADEIISSRSECSLIFVTCSALKRSYRTLLADVDNKNISVKFIFLKCSPQTLSNRLASRKGHYMGKAMLDSQLQTLEEPTSDENNVITIECDSPLSNVVSKIINTIDEKPI
ncbi:gluconokinase-like protein [Dinothrombium tinctorium]|uniref:Gluconokinase n=1 Tax=Dinothrombium tinctorium TaxID=1965070 RepID=A0A3S3PGZ5_9ACAR|nr:gluconokinase-like protein [Dinothrombium tinctorium]